MPIRHIVKLAFLAFALIGIPASAQDVFSSNRGSNCDQAHAQEQSAYDAQTAALSEKSLALQRQAQQEEAACGFNGECRDQAQRRAAETMRLHEIESGDARNEHRKRLVDIDHSTACSPQPAAGTGCDRAKYAEMRRYELAMAALQKEEFDIVNDYERDRSNCRDDGNCQTQAANREDAKLGDLHQRGAEEGTRRDQALSRIARGDCSSTETSQKNDPPGTPPPPNPSTNRNPPAGDRATTRGGGSAGGPGSPNRSGTPGRPGSNSTTGGTGGSRGTGIQAEEVLTPEHRNLLFKLGAEMNVIAQEQEQHLNPGTEFIGGVAEWARDTLELLAQEPGVPVRDMGEAIVAYLLNNNTANHKALKEAADEALKEFKKNPARTLGKTLPNLLPGPGESTAGVRFIRQVEQVEQAAGKISGMARAGQAFGHVYQGVLEDAAALGGAAPKRCFAENACFPTALAHAEQFKSGGPLGNGSPFRVNGVYNPLGSDIPEDLAHTPQQVFDRLQPYGKNFQPRHPSSFSPDELRVIQEGIPVPVSGPDRIKDILIKEGDGSQGLVVVAYRPTATEPKPLGHVFNAQNNNRVLQFIDHTLLPGADPLFTSALVEHWFYFPIQ